MMYNLDGADRSEDVKTISMEDEDSGNVPADSIRIAGESCAIPAYADTDRRCQTGTEERERADCVRGVEDIYILP